MTDAGQMQFGLPGYEGEGARREREKLIDTDESEAVGSGSHGPGDASRSPESTRIRWLPKWLRELGSMLKETGIEWLQDGIPARGAALSYYVLLSLGPLLVLLVGALEFVLTSEEAREGVVDALAVHIGPRAASTVAMVLQQVGVPNFWSPGSILTIGLLIFGATAAFANVRGSLNAIWGIAPEGLSKKEIAIDLLRARVRGFAMIVLAGFVITASFVVTSGAGLVARFVEHWAWFGSLVARVADAAVSFLVIGVLFAAIYRTLPSKRVEWSTVWVGAFATALVFVIGKSLVAWLIASAEWTSYYGPGASVVAFLAWIYLSSQIFFLGAEFTQVWSRRHGGVMSDETGSGMHLARPNPGP